MHGWAASGSGDPAEISAILRRVGGQPGRVPSRRGRVAGGREFFNLARIVVGSEGTLALTVAAKMRLAPLPPRRVLCSVQFDDLLEAMRATPVILEHGPSAVELIDRFMLDKTRGRIEYAPLREFFSATRARCCWCFFGQSDGEWRTRSPVGDLVEQGLALCRTGGRGEEQPAFWDLRVAALGFTDVSDREPRDSFVEDTGVPLTVLPIISRLQRIWRNRPQAGFYAHRRRCCCIVRLSST